MKKYQVVLGIMISLFLSGCTLNKTPNNSPQATPTDSKTEENINSSMRDLMARGVSFHCTFDHENSENKSRTKGELYLSGRKFFQDATVIFSEPTPREVVAKTISDGEYLYSWDTGNPSSGIKIKVDIEKAEENQQSPNQDNRNNLDKKIDMKCQKWSPDNSKFQIPTDIKFTDLSQMMETVKSKIPSMPAIPTIPSNNISE